MSKTKNWSWAALIVCALLYLVWPTAGTIAARKLLLVMAAITGIVLWLRSEDRYAILKSPWLIFMGLLLAWVVFHAAFLSQNGSEAWSELRGQWLPAYLAVLAGIGLALASRDIDPSVFRVYLLVILSAQAVLYLFVSAFKGIQEGHMAMEYWRADAVRLGTDLKTSLTINAELLAALSCAMFVESFRSGVRNNKRYFWLLPVALALYVAIFTSSLNAILLICAAIFLAMAMLAYQFRAKISRALVIAVILMTAISIYVASTLPAVHAKVARALSNAKIAVDVETYQHWKNIYPEQVPIAMGKPEPISFYHRVARATVGVGLIAENPLGYGVGRHAYQQLVQQKYPDANMVASSESGYLNLLSAVGFPALILFMLAIASVYMQLHKATTPWKRAVAWMIAISLGQLALDAVERDHFMEIYFFLIALAATMLTQGDRGVGRNAAHSGA